MNNKLVWAIALKDMRSIRRTSKVWIGLVVLPLILGVIIPAAVVSLGRWGDISALGGDQMTILLERLPAADATDLPDIQHRFVHYMINFMFVPLFILIPVTNAVMIAVNSFVGEKERRTLESLLFAPVEIRELFAGKLLASFIPAYASALASFLLSGVIINVLAYPMFGGLIFPSMRWLIIMLWVIPMFTVSAILFSVLVSARSSSFQEAQQVAGIIVLPIVGLLIGQSTGAVMLNPLLLLLIGSVLLLLNGLLLMWVARLNERDLLFERQVH
ncbi:ABC transporter permease subunit [Paenibacillus donghaensis]|uniref:ABC transporter permease n=1 Tax=Paenibacillus donghaensis TaxID=414771 RepID=A0A2Z2KAC6_9BACL|nr:ABC transporter permease subunit [Paenibacillus donghaensis]ASA22534.1 hypothetical protein B9T62_18150 [Paenibacillus donghaensis]